MKRTISPLTTTVVYYLAFISLGLIVAALGPTLPALAEQTQSSLRQISVLFIARSLGFLCGAFFVGRAYDRLTGHSVMAVMSIFMGVTMFLVPTIPLLWLLMIVMWSIGFGEGGLDLGGNTLIVWLHRDKVGPYMNGLHLVWGLGAFLSPLIIAQILQIDGTIRWAYWLLALPALSIPFWLVRLPSPTSTSVKTEVEPEAVKGSSLYVILIASFFFLYIGAEVICFSWIFTYATTLDLTDEIRGAYLTSAFFGALTVARVFAIPIALKFQAKQIMWADLMICLVCAVIPIVYPTSLFALWISIIGLGLGMASLFPTMLDLAQQYLTITGRVNSWFFIGASLGGMTFPWLVGQFFESIGPHIVMWGILGCLVLTTGAFTILTKLHPSS